MEPEWLRRVLQLPVEVFVGSREVVEVLMLRGPESQRCYYLDLAGSHHSHSVAAASKVLRQVLMVQPPQLVTRLAIPVSFSRSVT